MRPSLQDMVKAAMEGSVSRVKIAEENKHQDESPKTCPKCGKGMGQCSCGKAKESSANRNEYALKLASALEYIGQNVEQVEWKGASTPGEGPGALQVLESKTGPNPLQSGSGQAHTQPPMNPPMQSTSTKGPATAMQDNDTSKVVKTAEDLLASNLACLGLVKDAGSKLQAHFNQAVGAPHRIIERLKDKDRKEKTAEDAIFPAKISAGAAAPPPGGEPTPAQPEETARQAQMVASNQAAIDYTKGQAKAVPKDRLREVLKEPALTASTDKVLQQAFDHTSQAGVKISSTNEGVKVAAAKALLLKLAEEGAKRDATPEQKEKRERMLAALREKKGKTDKESTGMYGC